MADVEAGRLERAGSEAQKAKKIRAIAASGASIAREVGQDPQVVATFLDHYFRHVDADDIDERSAESLLGLVESHFKLALERRPGEPTVSVFDPAGPGNRWSADGATVVQIVTDDHPFLVDSVTMELTRQGWSLNEVFHPQFFVHRDESGRLTQVLTSSEAERDPRVIAESWMHLEVTPPISDEPWDELVRSIETGLREVLSGVAESVADWDAMRRRALDTVEELGATEPPAGSGQVDAAQVDAARELLRWLSDDHFTFLGYREYDVRPAADGETATMSPRSGTGLGILRPDEAAAAAFDAVPLSENELPEVGSTPLLVITKDNERSRVHRPSYLDYIGVRQFDASGRVCGERRFLGLLASSAYSESVSRIPVVRAKAREILKRSGYASESHGGKSITDVLDNYPRDELFQASVDELFPVVDKIAHLKERRQVRFFARRDPYGRYVSALVFLPRDRYTTTVRTAMEAILSETFAATSVEVTALLSESVLARLHFVLRLDPEAAPPRAGEVDVAGLEHRLSEASQTWDDRFSAEMSAQQRKTGSATGRIQPQTGGELVRLMHALPEGYKEDYTPRQALSDLEALASLRAGSEMELALYRPDDPTDEADLRLKIFRREASLSLSVVLPHLSLLGVDVIDERPYELHFGAHSADGSTEAETTGPRAFVYDFGLRVTGGTEAVGSRWTPQVRQQFMAAFRASYDNRCESDAYNRLVLAAGLDWRQASLLRAVGHYLRQAGNSYSQTYIATALSSNVDITTLLIKLFETKFDPDAEVEVERRQRAVKDLTARIQSALDDVASLDHDRIIRSVLAVLNAAVRTNFYQSGSAAIALKLLPRKIPGLPEPRPAFEIWVDSPQVEGVHLRFGSVARGGLRWSDRAEDFRTEILGLVKAQMVKNTVIVPVGAKGGFYGKRLPDPSVDRDAWLRAGIGCYRLFISALLDVTDNLRDGAIVPPEQVVRYDEDDPYLVVAADKGTATFSDIANSLAVEKSFWLGDAFASGGSAGYDHKAMGITARGAWESVIRHFRELGVDCQTTDFSCVGVGDMSGDVFGNGMLLSKHIRLVAAFDHRHVFLDPNPDPATSWAERDRMFALPRSSWADYDTALISEGGGVFARTLKSIPVGAAVRDVLGLADGVTALAPNELITAILKAPVDLLWNGGIGTYVKAASESNAEAGDKANDPVRVNGADLRARCVGEGGNLGLTQLGRIDYAAAGGLINTDFIDNSAGVDTSDHEVNIKILLAPEVAAGRLDRDDRNTLLASMTDEVAALVLANNTEQNLALANSAFQAPSMAGVHEDWMHRLEEWGLLDRTIEFLPGSEETARRRERGEGLRSPELCTLLAYTKIALEREILSSDLPDDPALHPLLIDYFPPELQQRYAEQMDHHRLHREIITTVAVNDFVNQSGITCFHRLSGETGAGAADLIRAQIGARSIFGAEPLEASLAALDHQVDAAVLTALRMELRTLVERATRWLVNNRRLPIDIAAAVAAFADGVTQVRHALPDLASGRDAEAIAGTVERSTEAGVPADVAEAIAVLPLAYAALTVVQTANRDELDPVDVARVHYPLAQRLGLDRLLARIVELPRDDRWQTMARAALRDDLHAVHARLTAEVLRGHEPAGTLDPAGAQQLIEAWAEGVSPIEQSVATLASICDGDPDLARMSVGLQIVRSLLPTDA